jgi:hypothetical protein
MAQLAVWTGFGETAYRPFFVGLECKNMVGSMQMAVLHLLTGAYRIREFFAGVSPAAFAPLPSFIGDAISGGTEAWIGDPLEDVPIPLVTDEMIGAAEA